MRITAVLLAILGLAQLSACSGKRVVQNPSTAHTDEITTDLITKLVQLDGTEVQLDSMRAQMQNGIAPYEKKMQADDYGLLQKSVDENFEGKALLKNYKRVLAGQISDADLKAAVDWFETPLARKFSQLQTESTTTGALVAIRALSNELAKKPADPNRDKLIKELQSALKATDLLVDLTVNMARGIAVGQLAARGEASQADLAMVRGQLDEVRKRSRPRIEHDAYVNNLYTYRSVSDDELREYISFFETKVGHSVIEASFYALNDSLQSAAEEVGREIGDLRRAMKGH